MTRAESLRADLKVDSLAGLPRALAEELIRTQEILEHLDKVIQGDLDAWLGIQARLPDGVELVINAPLAEARQQRLAFKALAAEYVKLTGLEVVAPPVSVADDLGKARDARKAAALAKAQLG